MKQLKIDPEFQSLIPPLSTEEREYLEQNIKSEGCRDALVTWNGVIVDGHNRYEICTRLNIQFKTIETAFKSRDEVIEWIIRNQFGRRNITAAVRAMLALKLEPIIKEKAKANQRIDGGNQYKSAGSQNSAKVQCPIDTRAEVAKAAGVSHDTVDKVKYIVNNGTPEQIDRVKQGGKGNSINAVRGEIIQAKHPEKKKCNKCGEEKDPSEFYAGKGTCKKCKNANIQTKDFLGNVIKSDAKTMAVVEEVAKSIYDTEKEVDYSVDDLVEELGSLSDYFCRNTESCLNDHGELLSTTKNKQKIMTALLATEAAIQKMKETYL